MRTYPISADMLFIYAQVIAPTRAEIDYATAQVTLFHPDLDQRTRIRQDEHGEWWARTERKEGAGWDRPVGVPEERVTALADLHAYIGTEK